jgi:carbamate kinase
MRIVIAPGAAAAGQVTPEVLAGREFAAGSTGPKVEAATRFAAKTGRRAAIGWLPDIAGIVAGTNVIEDKTPDGAEVTGSPAGEKAQRT